MSSTAALMRTFTRSSKTTTRTLTDTIPISRRTAYATDSKTKPSGLNKDTESPAFEAKKINHKEHYDAGNYLTGASTLSYGNAVFLLVAGAGVIWIGKKVKEEIKDVIWPKVKGVKGQSGEEPEGENEK